MKPHWGLALGWFFLGGAAAGFIGLSGLLFGAAYTAGLNASCQASLE